MSDTEVHVQWKGTDVCLDFRCVCGYRGHYDGGFAYQLRCGDCGRLWEMPHTFTLAEATGESTAQPTEFPHDGHVADGPDEVTPVDT